MLFKKLFAATLGVFVGAVLFASPAAAAPVPVTAPTAVDCTTYESTGSSTFRPGFEAYPWSYFWSEGEETFSFCVDVPDSAEVVVQVREYSVPNQQWETVLTASSGPGDKEFTYDTEGASLYRLYVTGVSGSGTYLAGITFSR